MEGTRSTIGLSARINTVFHSDSCLIHCMKNSGMIPFIKTNLPQLALTYDSDNFVWGTVSNAWNKKKSAGGSSGG
jgi:Asp-tRNA(Asn)/Glu-tRNA(Gln) amidotransferase A subunit family amidase